jgi:4'-phosphopantetheinyl transferase
MLEIAGIQRVPENTRCAHLMGRAGPDRPSPTAPRAIAPGEVHLWYVRLAALDDPGLLARYLALLQPEERDRHGKFTIERLRHEHLVARALVRTALSSYLPVSPAEWRFRSGPHGRPELDPPRPLRFNLSHSGDLVVCVVADGADVGVDVEPYGRAGKILGLSGRVLSDGERAALSALGPEQARGRALTLWTLKESYVKALGIGISVPLRRLSFSVGDGPIGLGSELDPAEGSRWCFEVLDLVSHRVAVALAQARDVLPKVRIWESVPLVRSVPVNAAAASLPL